jgi:hypothetical protein
LETSYHSKIREFTKIGPLTPCLNARLFASDYGLKYHHPGDDFLTYINLHGSRNKSISFHFGAARCAFVEEAALAAIADNGNRRTVSNCEVSQEEAADEEPSGTKLFQISRSLM